MPNDQQLCVADARRIDEILKIMAAEIAVSIPEDLMLLGIRRRGVPIAERLAELLNEHHSRSVPVSEVTVKRYADDLSLLHRQPALTDTGLPEWDGAFVLVDDVLFTGRSLLRVLQWLQAVEPARVDAAVLCARNAQEMPVRARFVGMHFDVGPHGVIDVHVPPYEHDAAVWLSFKAPGD